MIESNKESYYLALQKTQRGWQNHHPNWNPWLIFFLNCLQRQKNHLEIKLAREKILSKRLTPLAQRIVELLVAHGRLGISEIAALTHANRNTLKKTLAALVKENYIVRNGVGRASWYSSKI